METMLRDKLLVCATCATEFVWTVAQQRMVAGESSALSEPRLCPVCEVKRERGLRVARTLNGNHAPNGASAPNGETNGHPAPLQVNGEGAALSSDERLPISPNRPPSYRSGLDHPLHGHGGEVHTGQVKWFNDRKGFGFLLLDSGEEIFVHYSAITSEGYRSLKQHQRVQLTIEDTPKGPQASQVQLLSEPDAVGETPLEVPSPS